VKPGKSSRIEGMTCAGHGSRGPNARGWSALGMGQTSPKHRALGCGRDVAEIPGRDSPWAYCRRRPQYGELVAVRDDSSSLQQSGFRCRARDGKTPVAPNASGCLRRAKRAGVVRSGCDTSEGMRSSRVRSRDTNIPLRGRFLAGVRDGTTRGSSSVRLEYGRGSLRVIVKGNESRGGLLGRVARPGGLAASIPTHIPRCPIRGNIPPQRHNFSPQLQPPQPRGFHEFTSSTSRSC